MLTPGGSMKPVTVGTTNNLNNNIINGSGDDVSKVGAAGKLVADYTLLPSPIKGVADWRNYRCMKLSNGVTVCLVHDKESKTTATTAIVNVGAGADPRSMSGLAHFCEHMCFLGSKKYPGENEYKKYLSTHGGRSNGSTSLHTTLYKFEIVADYAEHAIDIFSNFFIAPLFTLSGTVREINAVDSENSKNLVADIRRRLQILKSIGRNDHYFTKFTTGNTQTLPTTSDDDVTKLRHALLAFHTQHYHPTNLTVVVAGPQSLETLEEWVVPRFATMTKPAVHDDVPIEIQHLIQDAAQQLPPFDYTAPDIDYRSPFEPSLQKYLLLLPSSSTDNTSDSDDTTNTNPWPIELVVKPVRSMRKLVLLFPLPPTYKKADQNPIAVLSHLLGHEGPHSPFAVLQNMGYISKLSSGSRFTGPDFTTFQIDIDLTELGDEHWRNVVDVILQHCRLITTTAQAALREKQQQQESSPNLQYLQQLWMETVELNKIFFNQSSPGSVYDFAPNLCSNIVQYGTEKALSKGRMLYETPETFPLEDVVEFVSQITSSNLIIERCGQKAWDEMEQLITTLPTVPDQENLYIDNNRASYIERKTEPWYGIDFFISRIAPTIVQRWDGIIQPPFVDASTLIQLPHPNRYIPRSLELCTDLPPEATQGPRIEKDIDPPNLLIDDTTIGRLWHRLDDRYALPKSAVRFLLRTSATEHIPNENEKDGYTYNTQAAIQSLFLTAVYKEALAQETYDASLAGLHWDLSLGTTGIQITCHGFSDRLPDLVLSLLQEFLTGDFIKESFFLSAKDRMIRNLRTYFESRRADAHAQYYRDFILVSSDYGIDPTLQVVEAATFDVLKEHHSMLVQRNDLAIDCLFSGNVSEKDATDFFTSATTLIANTNPTFGKVSKDLDSYRPGATTRRIIPGNDIELHFASKNPQEENGACMITYQSAIPGYRGKTLSSKENLHTSACIRLICHMLREPLFDELRTKQTLGYIVSSYHDVGFSAVPSTDLGLQQSVPIDLIVIYVLSKKVPPTEIVVRIDEFLKDFRDALTKKPDSEIKHHATALSTKLRKPIQKLETESSTQYTKIRRYASEILGSKKSTSSRDIPWDSANCLAKEIESLTRDDIINVWDTTVLNPASRARIVSCVYGTTFPLDRYEEEITQSKSTNNKTNVFIVNSLEEALQHRNQLPIYDTTSSIVASRRFSFVPRFANNLFQPQYTSSLSRGLASRTNLVTAAAAIFGVGLVAAAGWAFFGRNNNNNNNTNTNSGSKKSSK